MRYWHVYAEDAIEDPEDKDKSSTIEENRSPAKRKAWFQTLYDWCRCGARRQTSDA